MTRSHFSHFCRTIRSEEQILYFQTETEALPLSLPHTKSCKQLYWIKLDILQKQISREYIIKKQTHYEYLLMHLYILLLVLLTTSQFLTEHSIKGIDGWKSACQLQINKNYLFSVFSLLLSEQTQTSCVCKCLLIN